FRSFDRILMHLFTEAAAHDLDSENRRIAVFITQAIRGEKSARPFLPAITFQQIHLFREILKVRSVHTEQADQPSLLPVSMKEVEDGREDLGVHLNRRGERMGASDGCEIGIAKFKLKRARGKALFTQPPTYLRGKMSQRGFQLANVSRV